MKAILALILIATIALTACVNQANTPRACTEEAKICPDGSAVGRIGPNCEFAPCPTSGTQIANPASKNCVDKGGTLEIKTGSDGGQYGECTLSDGAVCEEWAYFRGECPANTGKHICTAEEKAAEMCTMEYAPVCGDDGVTYGNKCSACASKKIDWYVNGECGEDKFAVVKKQQWDCSNDNDCELPMFYAVQSSCPYAMKCLEKKCKVICPYTSQEEYDRLHSVTEADRECETCPMYEMPAPDFCPNGTITTGPTDACGCHGQPRCEPKEEKLKATDCTEPRTQACTREYMPVCGWFNTSIKCIRYPCAAEYSNKCVACADGKVAYWTEGECPE